MIGIVIVLTILLIAQQAYWGIVTHKLIDKLMSRNYHEYKSAKEYTGPAKRQPMPQDGELEDFGSLKDFGPL